ncbi:MAG: acireductone synthase [Candidatus Thiodiazotropha sp.]
MIKAIVTDIEGTTSSLSFVKDVLFPYAHEHICGYIRSHADETEVAEQLALVSQEAGRELTLDEAGELLLQWIDDDKKITPLKALQGMIWEAGYRNGDFSGHIYEDAVRNLKLWKEKGVRLYVYSSGSVYAQKLLFGFTEYGDLTPLFSGYFDTRTGHKQESSSYEIITSEIGERAGDILFLSDVREELDAARAAGMQTRWLVRDAESIEPQAPHAQVKDFDAISLD